MATALTNRDGSLAPVRAAIPEGCYQRSTRRGLRSVVGDVAAYAVVLWALGVTDRWWIDVPLVLLAGAVVSGLFVLGHDAAHDALTDSDALNRRVALVLMLPSLHVRSAWELGHNRVHHGFTARQGVDFVWQPTTLEDWASMSRSQRARHRFEWSAVGAGAYYLREVWWNKMITFDPPQRDAVAIRADRRIVAAFAAIVTVATIALGWSWSGPVEGLWLWAQLWALPFLVFSQVIGWTVYVHHVGPDIPWWTRQEWTRRRAQTESTTILRIPRVLDLLFHNIFVHVPHHVDMRIPWYHLPEAAAAIEAAFPGTLVDKPFRVGDYLGGVRRCKLYDFEARRWLTYPSPADQVQRRPGPQLGTFAPTADNDRYPSTCRPRSHGRQRWRATVPRWSATRWASVYRSTSTASEPS